MKEFPPVAVDKEQLLQHLTDEPKRVIFLSKDMLSDKDIARAVLYSKEAKKNDLLRYFPESIKDDLALIASALPNIQSASESVRSNKTLMTDILNERPWEFGYSGQNLFEDDAYCRHAIEKLPSNVSRLPKDHPLLNDRSLAIEVVGKDPHMMEKFVKFQDDAEVIHVAYKSEEWIYSAANPDQMINTNDETILQFASERIQTACETNDPHKVLAAMTLERKMQKSLAPKQEARKPSLKI